MTGARRQQVSRGPDIHTSDVAAHELAALVMRPRATLHRLIRLIPGLAARIDRAEAAAYEEAERQAFRAGSSLEALKPVAPPRTAVVPPSTVVTRPLASIARQPGAERREPDVKGAVATDSQLTGQTVASETLPADKPAVAERVAGPNRRKAGETAPDHLLRSPTIGTTVADDFFDGLIRRVEGGGR